MGLALLLGVFDGFAFVAFVFVNGLGVMGVIGRYDEFFSGPAGICKARLLKRTSAVECNLSCGKER